MNSTPQMSKPIVFLDSNVIFSAFRTTQSKPGKIIEMSFSGEITAYFSWFVLAEVHRNLKNKVPEVVPTFEQLIDQFPLQQIVRISAKEVDKVATYCEKKDAPVVAGAIKAGAEYLITGDEKHLIRPTQVAEKSGLKIITPAQFLDGYDTQYQKAA